MRANVNAAEGATSSTMLLCVVDDEMQKNPSVYSCITFPDVSLLPEMKQMTETKTYIFIYINSPRSHLYLCAFWTVV